MTAWKLDPPGQVVAALVLLAAVFLWNNLAYTLGVATRLLSGRIAEPNAAPYAILEFVIWAFAIGLAGAIACGFNWARWLTLASVVFANLPYLYLIPEAIAAKQQSYLIVLLINVTLESGALYLLFLSPGRLWFERRGRPTAA